MIDRIRIENVEIPNEYKVLTEREKELVSQSKKAMKDLLLVQGYPYFALCAKVKSQKSLLWHLKALLFRRADNETGEAIKTAYDQLDRRKEIKNEGGFITLA